MAKTRTFQRKFPIEQEQQFTDPIVRFRRIRGRIVPIVNRHRIGRIYQSRGQELQAGGAALLGVAAARAMLKKPSNSAGKAALNQIKKMKKPVFKKNPSKLRKLVGLLGKTVKTPRAMAITGGVLLGSGSLLVAKGIKDQMRSQLGFDIGGSR